MCYALWYVIVPPCNVLYSMVFNSATLLCVYPPFCTDPYSLYTAIKPMDPMKHLIHIINLYKSLLS